MKFEKLTKKEQNYWIKKGKNLSSIELLWLGLIDRKKCIWCHKKYLNGIIRKLPHRMINIDSFLWFTNEFLIHAQTTHGYNPDTINILLDKISKENGTENHKN